MVVFDIWKGEMTGLELQEQLREHSPHARGIIMTGQVDPGAANRALNAGAVAFFAKPFDDQQFLSAVRSALPDRA
jgi:two-component system, LuxR family, response regulator FixJ